jgi:hypothetical protein
MEVIQRIQAYFLIKSLLELFLIKFEVFLSIHIGIVFVKSLFKFLFLNILYLWINVRNVML